MATDNSQNNLDLDVTMDRAEGFFNENKKTISIIFGILIGICAAYFGYKFFYLEPQEKLAQSQMFMAEKYFEKDSLKKAINGDGNFLGFTQIIEEYSMTPSANLAHYYLGISYLKTGKYEMAIEELEDFDSNDEVIKPIAIGAIGDAYAELNETEKAASHYLEASQKANNKFISPIYLMKAGLCYEQLKKYADAAEIYSQIKKDYFDTNEGRDADKYIARAKAMIQ